MVLFQLTKHAFNNYILNLSKFQLAQLIKFIVIEKEIIRSRCNGLKLFLYKKKKKIHFIQEWERVGFGPGFSIPGSNPRVLVHGPDLARLLNGFFSQGLDLPRRAHGPVQANQIWAQSAAQPKKKRKKEKKEN